MGPQSSIANLAGEEVVVSASQPLEGFVGKGRGLNERGLQLLRNDGRVVSGRVRVRPPTQLQLLRRHAHACTSA
jgi:hypothetical protein